MRRAAWVGAVIVAAATCLFLLWSPTPPQSAAPKNLPIRWSVDRTTAPEFTQPRRLLLSPQAPEPSRTRLSAAGLRAKARSDGNARAELLRDLRDPTLSRAYRSVIALVLGSLDDPGLQEALAQELQTASDGEWKSILLHALGAEKDCADDEIFDLEDTPFVYDLAGLRLAIRTSIQSGPLLAIMEPFLRDGDAEVRRAAARALIHSVAQPRVREAFVGLLQSESDEGLRAGYGQALAGWAGSRPAGTPERDATVEKLLEVAARPEEGAVRFRLEAPLRQQTLTPREVSALVDLAQAGSADQQLWSLTLLTNRSEARGNEVEAACGRLTAAATPPKVREYAAKVLAGIRTPTATRSLEGLLQDGEWNVRAAAAAALGGRESARTALERVAAADLDERVRQAAAESLKRPLR